MSINVLKLFIFFVVLGVSWIRTGWAGSIQAAEKARYQANDDFYRALESTPPEQRTSEKIKELEKKHIEPAQSRLRQALKSDLDQRVRKYGFKPVTEKEYDQMISKHRETEAGDEESPTEGRGLPQAAKARSPQPQPKSRASDSSKSSGGSTPEIDGSGLKKEIDF